MLRAPLSIHPDIARAELPPAWLYSDPEVLALARERLFARTWQLAGDTSQIGAPGSISPFRLLPGCLDEPLLWTRDSAGDVHCLSNVCTHRANLVVNSPGRAAHLRCGYHGRTFDLAGRMRASPEFEGAQDFPSPRDDLQPAAWARLGNLLFAAVDPAFPFDALIADVRRRLAWLPLERAAFDAGRSRDYAVRANWILYCDNYLEGLHVPFVHASLNAALDFQRYRTDLYRWSSVQIGAAEPEVEALEPPDGAPEAGQRVAAYYAFLFPNTMVNVYPWGLSLNVVTPVAIDRSVIAYRTYVWDERLIARSAGAELDRVEHEDEAVVEAVQQGMRARLFRRGRYSPAREQAVHHFHGLLAEFLRD